MGRRFLVFVCAAFLAWTPFASAEDVPSGFGAPVLDAPPREESGPLAKQPIDRRSAQPPANTIDLPSGDGAAGEAASAPVIGDQTQLKAYVDGLMSGLIVSGEFPGAAVLVIQDGKVTLKAGYGFADLRSRVPVDPDRTRFRVASVSKLVTATAVMQLIEQGKVDLNADVNTYLSGFKIAPTYPEPVTLANILTHTAGFDDKYLGIAAPMSTMVEPLGQYLAHAMPPRVLPPGKTFAYSNHGFGLAGHIVETVSGQEFKAYLQESVFDPLGMASSTFGVPYPAPAELAVPYSQGGPEGGFTRGELDRLRAAPAGDLITTAGDIAKFMLVHLNNGVYGDDEHLLAQPTIERMQAQHFVQAEGLDGWAYGFMEGHRNGVRWIGHDGSWIGFCAQLVMVPATKSGFFVVYNADCSFAASATLRKALFDALWPSKAPIAADPDPQADMRAQAIAGTYMAMRRARSDFTSMAAGAGQITVSAPGDGQLVVRIPDVGRDLTFLPQANGIWINPDFQMKAAAVADGAGRPLRLAIDSDVYERVVGAAEWSIWSVALGVVVALCTMALWGWTNGFLSRQFFGEPQAVITFLPRVTAFVAAGLVVVSLVTMAALLNEKMPLSVLHGPTPMLMVLLSVPVAIGVLAVPMVVWSMIGFGVGLRARLAQLGYAILTIAVLVFLAFAWQWGLHPFAMLDAN